MNHFSYEQQQKRYASISCIHIAKIIAGILSFVFGAGVIPLLLFTAIWLWNRLSAIPAGQYYDLLDLVTRPAIAYGVFWLCYYLVTFYYAAWNSPRRGGIEPAYNELPNDQMPNIPLSYGWPGELKWQLLQRCYETFYQATQRYHPPKVHLAVPPPFAYYKGRLLFWDGDTPLLPEDLLTPEHIHELMPLLAHHLGTYNSKLLDDDDLADLPTHVPLWPLLALTGNFLWLPVIIRRLVDNDSSLSSKERQRKQVNENDEYAYHLGQGPALEHLLRRIRAEAELNGLSDENVPTVSERIGHLEALNQHEREEMRTLGLQPKEPPLQKQKAGRPIRS